MARSVAQTSQWREESPSPLALGGAAIVRDTDGNYMLARGAPPDAFIAQDAAGDLVLSATDDLTGLIVADGSDVRAMRMEVT